MAKQVEGISEKVELCAKKEFLEKGYVDAHCGRLLRRRERRPERSIPDMVEKKDFFQQS